jgi:hypothetical protein
MRVRTNLDSSFFNLDVGIKCIDVGKIGGDVGKNCLDVGKIGVHVGKHKNIKKKEQMHIAFAPFLIYYLRKSIKLG